MAASGCPHMSTLYAEIVRKLNLDRFNWLRPWSVEGTDVSVFQSKKQAGYVSKYTRYIPPKFPGICVLTSVVSNDEN